MGGAAEASVVIDSGSNQLWSGTLDDAAPFLVAGAILASSVFFIS